MKLAGLIGAGFILAPMIMNNMYAKRPFKLTAIDAGYHIVSIITVTIIMAKWY
jgi:hypothetical protein